MQRLNYAMTLSWHCFQGFTGLRDGGAASYTGRREGTPMLNTYDYLPTKPESPRLLGQGSVHCQKRPQPWEPEGCNPFPGLRTFKRITGEIFFQDSSPKADSGKEDRGPKPGQSWWGGKGDVLEP